MSLLGALLVDARGAPSACTARAGRRRRGPRPRSSPSQRERVEDDRDALVGAALLVGVLDAEDEGAAGLAGPEPVEERRADAADVQVPGRRGAKRTRAGVMRRRVAEGGARSHPAQDASASAIACSRRSSSPARASTGSASACAPGPSATRVRSACSSEARERTETWTKGASPARDPQGHDAQGALDALELEDGGDEIALELLGLGALGREPREGVGRDRGRSNGRMRRRAARAPRDRCARASVHGAARTSSWRGAGHEGADLGAGGHERRVALRGAEGLPRRDADATEGRARRAAGHGEGRPGEPERGTGRQEHDGQHADDLRARRSVSRAIRARCSPRACARARSPCAGARARGRRGEARDRADRPAAAQPGTACPWRRACTRAGARSAARRRAGRPRRSRRGCRGVEHTSRRARWSPRRQDDLRARLIELSAVTRSSGRERRRAHHRYP